MFALSRNYATGALRGALGVRGATRSLTTGSGNRAEAKPEAEADVDADAFLVADDEAELARVQTWRTKIRNRSRLNLAHNNLAHGRPPHDRAIYDQHLTLAYQQKLYGAYGEASGIDPKICWMTKEMLNLKKENERMANPYTLEKMVKMVKYKKEKAAETVRLREEMIAKKITKLEEWKTELRVKTANKLAAAEAVKAKKEALIEDVRRQFGFKIDPKDERFQKLLAEKEKQQKKAEKLARRTTKDSEMILNIQKMNANIS